MYVPRRPEINEHAPHNGPFHGAFYVAFVYQPRIAQNDRSVTVAMARKDFVCQDVPKKGDEGATREQQ